MSKSIEYTTTIEKSPGKGGWHFVRIPDDVRTELARASSKNGNVPVLVTIGKTTWPSTSMSMGDQQWFVAVKSDVRAKESLAEGDKVHVLIAPDLARLESKDPLPYIGRPATSALAEISVTRANQLKDFTEADLLAIHGIGPKAIRMLREAGVKLKEYQS